MEFEFTPNSKKYKREQQEEQEQQSHKKHPIVSNAKKSEKKQSPIESLIAHFKTDMKLAKARVYEEAIVPGLIDLVDSAIDITKNVILYEGRGILTGGKSSGKRAYEKAYRQQRMIFDGDQSDTPKPRKKSADTFSIPDKEEAGEVLDSLKDDIKQYGCATLYDYYCSLGVDDADNDAENKNWGWTDLRGAYITRGPAGYTLVMPNTVRLSM